MKNRSSLPYDVEFLVEEPSAKDALSLLLPTLLPGRKWRIHDFGCKTKLLEVLPDRLRTYENLLTDEQRVVVLIDRDGEDCGALKQRLEGVASDAGLLTKTGARGRAFQILNRIVVEELEAWFFGDVEAIIQAYPKVPASLNKKQGYRDPDAVAGGTWEALHRVLRQAGHLKTTYPKRGVAQAIARHMDPARNRSKSFQVFCDGLSKLW